MNILLAITAAVAYGTIGMFFPIPVLTFSALYLVGCYFIPRLRCWIGFHDYEYRYIEEDRHVVTTVINCRRCPHTQVIDNYVE